MAVKTPPHIRGLFRLVLCLFALTLLCPVLPAELESGYYKVPGPGGIQFVQRLSWPKNENASQYELEVERRAAKDAAAAGSGEYTGVYRIITKEVSAEFSLSPGDYRYRVILYNLLRQPEYTAAWVEFSILLALQPELSGFSPRSFFVKRNAVLELVLDGRNLVPGSEIRLERQGRFLPPRGYHLDPSGERAFLIYDAPDLSAGNYTIRVTNPGGLEASLPNFWIESSSTFQVLLAYAPILPANGYVFELFDDPFHPAGAEVRAAWLPLNAAWGTVGLEAAFGWSYLKDRQNHAGISTHFGELGLNLLYRRELNPHFAFKVRAGGGSGGILNLVFDYGSIQSNPYNTISPMADLGVSMEWIIHRSFYAELGMDGFFVFSKDTPQPLYFRPFIGVGWQH